MLYKRANLAKDASLPPGPSSSIEFSLCIPAGSRAEVDGLFRQAESAGGDADSTGGLAGVLVEGKQGVDVVGVDP